MKILQINSVCGIKSTGRICADIAETLESRGHECKILFGRDSVPEQYQKYAYRITSDMDVKINALLARILDNAGFGTKRYTKKAIKYIKKYDPDIVHLHNIHGYYINVEILFSFLKEFKKPVIWTLHDCWAFTGHCAHFDLIKCGRWKNRCYDCPQKSNYPKSILLDCSKSNYVKKKKLFSEMPNMKLVTPSNWLKSVTSDSFLSKYATEIIPNGINLEKFKPTEGNIAKELGVEENKIILGVASEWSKSKGLNDFISLVELLPEEYKIVLVGLEDNQINLLPDKIIGLRKTNNIEELAELYTSAYVFFNPSKEETMGLTTVEAMACGTPAIVYNCTAVPEVIDETCGIIVEKGDLIAVVDAIEHLDIDSEACIKKAQLYDKWDKFNDYIRLYERIKGTGNV